MTDSSQKSLPPDINNSAVAVAILSCTLTLALVLFFARIYVRIRVSRQLWWEDWALCAAIPMSIYGYATIVASAKHGLGKHKEYVAPPDLMYIAHSDYLRLQLWLWSTTLIRISVGLLLIRLKSNRLWVYSIAFVICLEIAACITGTVIGCIQCTPIAANWNPFIPGANCWQPAQMQVILYTVSSISIAVDFIYSLLPLTFIVDIQLPAHEKVILAFLMSLGLFASAAAVVKMTEFKVYDLIQDPSWNILPAALWSRIEEHIGIIATCIPCLRGPFQQALKRLGIMTSIKSAMYGSDSTSTYRKTNKDTQPDHTEMVTTKSMDASGGEKAGVGRVSGEMTYQV